MDDDLARLRARGVPVELIDGSTLNLRFDMWTLGLLEEEFGGLARVQGAISQDGTGPMISPTRKLIYFAMLAELGYDTPEREAVTKLDPAKFREYVDAVNEALNQALPPKAEGTADPTPPATATNGSHGVSSTTSPPSSSVEAITTSGG
jgi:hypothetical protein